jgi:hypothetical protein
VGFVTYNGISKVADKAWAKPHHRGHRGQLFRQIVVDNNLLDRIISAILGSDFTVNL